MAIATVNKEWCAWQEDYRTSFIVDTEDDIAVLPKCCAGSSALVVATGNVYMVNASGEWSVFGG